MVAKQATQVQVRTASREGELSDCTTSTSDGEAVAKQATQVEVRTASREGELSDCTMSKLDGGRWRNRGRRWR